MGEVSCETMCGVLRLGDVHMGVCYIILSTFVCLKTSTMEKKFSKVQFRCLTNRRQSFFPPFILFCTCSTLSPHLCFSVPFRFLLPHCLSVPWDKIFVLVFTPDAQQSAWLAGVQYVFIELSGKSNSRMHQKYL